MKNPSKLFLLIILIVVIAFPESVIAANYSPSPLRPTPPANKPSLILPYSDPSVKIKSGFGTSTHNDVTFTTHTYYGIDFGAENWGQFEVIAAASGTLTQMTWTASLPVNVSVEERAPGCDEDIDPNKAGSQARVAVIDHGNGWKTIYMHLGSYLHNNGHVNQGDPIGMAGCSGAYWPHLHFELRNYFPDGKTVWSYNPDFSPIPTGPSLDLAFLIDTTGSMYDDIDRVKADVTQIINSIKDKTPNSRIAVLDFRDFPSRAADYDYPYRDVLPFTYSRDDAINAILSLDLGYGGDAPETQNCAIMHVIANDRCAGQGADTSLGPWASSSKRMIIMTDAPALNPEPFTGFTLEQVTARAKSGGFSFELHGGIDDGFGGEAPPPEGVEIYPVIIGEDPSALDYGQALADSTGGKVFTAATADQVVQAMLEAITDATKTATFEDVPTNYWSWDWIERLYAAGITGGCNASPPMYCPLTSVSRAQMAVFLERGIHGSSYAPPSVGGSTGYGDVSPTYWAAAWIKQLAAEGITGGCGAGSYCPEFPVTRAQMAVFLLRAKHGSSYSPPPATGVFNDVPPTYWARAWIEQLAAEGITSGCGSVNYCPESPVTRDQMAVFLVRTFNLP
jgi:murein DD-endopeptidase MepM/ murein hydrolase activator NlpD